MPDKLYLHEIIHFSVPRGWGSKLNSHCLPAFAVCFAKAQASHEQVFLQALSRAPTCDGHHPAERGRAPSAGHLLSKELLLRTWLIHVLGPVLWQANLLSSWLMATAACLLRPEGRERITRQHQAPHCRGLASCFFFPQFKHTTSLKKSLLAAFTEVPTGTESS